MARRRQDLADKLGSGAPVPGWRDMVSTGQPAERTPAEKTGETMRKTYLLSAEIIERVANLAQQERVGVNELARYLLTYALDEIESGRHQLPTQKEERRRIVP